MNTRDELRFHPLAGDAMIAQLATLMESIRAHEFPALVAEEVTDDGETYTAHRCPVCGGLVTDADDLYAVDFSERWNPIELDAPGEGKTATAHNGGTEYGETVYYLHDSGTRHGVSLPNEYREEWE